MMVSCKEVSKLVSEGVDRRLSFTARLQVKTHLLMCRSCARYERRLRFLRDVARSLSRSARNAIHEATGFSADGEKALKKQQR